MFTVRVAELVMQKAHERFGAERSATGRPSEYDFVSGPLAAAIDRFRYFDDIHETLGPAIRTLIATDPFFGAVVFVGVLIDSNVVEIADFEDDPDYWSTVDPLT